MDAPQRDFVKGKSRYRVIELPVELEHAAVRVQVLAQRNESGHGNAVFKPMFYVLGDGDEIVDQGVEVAEADEVVWRSNGDYPNVTIGFETYHFEAGKKYKTSRNVYLHLEEKGCVWH